MDATIVTLKFHKDGSVDVRMPNLVNVNYITIQTAYANLIRTFGLRMEEEGRKNFTPTPREPEVEKATNVETDAINFVDNLIMENTRA